MKIFLPAIIFLLFFSEGVLAQVNLNADGPGNTYNLITSVLAPGANPIETPDCSHTSFGNHIDEIYDQSLNNNVFRFHLHTSPDDDRCMLQDRQRNEIKTYDQSPDNLKGIQNEIVRYKWKFKLSTGFQSSPKFTHLHQLKSVGGALASMPMYTLTTRKGNPDRLELRYAETDTQITLTQIPLAPFIDQWLDVTETITYGTNGTYSIRIINHHTGSILLDYNNMNIINWRPGATFVRPKWGIYRSLIFAQDLRDETLLFADFSIEELSSLSIDEVDPTAVSLKIYPNPAQDQFTIANAPQGNVKVAIQSIDGKLIKNFFENSDGKLQINTVGISKGSYMVTIVSDTLKAKSLLIISR